MATDKKLWLEAKKVADKIYDRPSAYKSGFITKYYKEHGGKFIGKKPTDGLTRWYKERWVNQHGTTGYKHKNDVYRPSRRISAETPTTWKELTKKQIKAAQRLKAKGSRVKQFKK